MADLRKLLTEPCPHCNGPMMPLLDFTAGATIATCQRGCTDRVERDALAARVETLEAQRDEALKVLSTKGATNYEKVQAVGLIMSRDPCS